MVVLPASTRCGVSLLHPPSRTYPDRAPPLLFHARYASGVYSNPAGTWNGPSRCGLTNCPPEPRIAYIFTPARPWAVPNFGFASAMVMADPSGAMSTR